jgi:stage V sporulation protein S
VIHEQHLAEVQAVGAAAVYQAVKALATAHRYLQAEQMDIVVVPSFLEIEIDGQARTAIRFTVFPSPQLDFGQFYGVGSDKVSFRSSLAEEASYAYLTCCNDSATGRISAGIQ